MPPDIGASTKCAVPLEKAFVTDAATSCEEEGSIVEQSIKMRGLGREENLAFKIEVYTDLTWLGSGRAVMTTSWKLKSQISKTTYVKCD